ncbi:MAG TPA: glucuronate isomerase [Patescibacteria group bacterium]|nr:glucuronate isomerase [Patescibacteria group bacterium]
MKIKPPRILPLARQIEELVGSTRILDIHTHLYDPAFKDLLLWGIDELLTYHYLVAEAFRYFEMPYDKFWALPKSAQADLIWDSLFLKHSPISEACRGVLTTLQLFGLDVKKRDLPALRKWFASRTVEAHVNECFEMAGLSKVFMTNSPFDDLERPVWEKGFQRDERFEAGLRIDPLLLSWQTAGKQLSAWGYQVQEKPNAKTFDEVRRFLADWTKRIQARYLMVSLGPDFAFPDSSLMTQLIERSLLPHCREYGLPFALMPGVRRAVNPRLRLAGDGVGLANLTPLQNLCAAFPDNKFMATILSRENQHEACVLARKFRNLHIFGCWWFTNIPQLVEEITRMRIELVGLSFTAQHSDARVLDQVAYKWRHFRQVLTKVLTEEYTRLADTGWQVSEAELRRDIQDLFGAGFVRWAR